MFGNFLIFHILCASHVSLQASWTFAPFAFKNTDNCSNEFFLETSNICWYKIVEILKIEKLHNFVGPGGDLRIYLEGLLKAEHVQKYVEQHPFGQRAIDDTSSDWNFYSDVLCSLLGQSS